MKVGKVCFGGMSWAILLVVGRGEGRGEPLIIFEQDSPPTMPVSLRFNKSSMNCEFIFPEKRPMRRPFEEGKLVGEFSILFGGLLFFRRLRR